MKLKTTHFLLKPKLLWLFLLISSLSWGQTTGTIVITQGSSGITQNGYDSGAERTWIQNGVSFGAKYVMKEGGQTRIQFQANNGLIYNTSPLPGKIVKIIINQSNSNSSNLYVSNSGNINLVPVNQIGTNSSTGWTLTPASNYNYFAIKRSSGATYWTSLTIEYEILPVATPVLNVTPETISGLNYNFESGPSVAQPFTISGSNLTGTTQISTPTNFQISQDGISFLDSSIILQNYTGNDKIIYVRLKAGLSPGNYIGPLQVASTNLTKIINLNGSVKAKPVGTPHTLPSTYGVPTSYTLEATNSPTSFDLAPEQSLPEGLNLNISTGQISGTLLAAGNYDVSFTASNSAGTSDVFTITFNIGKASQDVSLPNIIKGTLDAPFNLPLNTNQSLLLIYSSDNADVATVTNNTVTIVGAGIAIITASNSGDLNYNELSQTFELTVLNTPVVSDLSIISTIGESINYNVQSSVQNVTFALAAGSLLPPGLSLNSTTGIISGNATAAGNFTTQIIASINSVASQPGTISFTILNTSPCIVEDFSSITAGNNTSSGGSGTQITTGELTFFPSRDRAYSAGGAVKLGSGSNSGYIETGNLSEVYGTVIVTIDVKGWTDVEGHLEVTLGNETQILVYSATMSDPFERKTLTFENLQPGSKLKIQTSTKRAFINYVSICDIAETIDVCENATINDLNNLFPNENNLTWFVTQNSTVAFDSTHELIEAIYYKQIGNNSTRTPYLVANNPLPSAPLVDAVSFCGTTTIANHPQGGEPYKWYISNTDTEVLLSSTQLATGTYYVSTTTNGCESERTEVQVTINEIPELPIIENQTYCESVLASELPNSLNGLNYIWYTSETGTELLNIQASITQTTTYYVLALSSNGCESERIPVQVTINEIPVAPSANPQTFCGTATVSNLPNESGNYNWYNNLTSDVALEQTITLSTGTYYVSTTINGCESERTEVQVTINEIPELPIIDDQVYCGSVLASELPSASNGLTYIWYTSETGTELLDIQSSITQTTTYYILSVSSNGCYSERTPVQVTINVIPDAPIVSAQAFCDAATVSELPQGNGAYKWYLSSDANEELTSTTELVTGTYYVSVTSLENCESDRTSVSIVINTTPNAPIVEAQTFCGPQTVSELPQENGTYKWYNNENDAEALAQSAQLVTGIYFVSTTTNNCESERTQVQVTINEIPNAPTVASQTFCGPQTIANLPNGNGTYKWYNTNSAAQALASTTSLSTGLYFVSTTINGCESEKTQVQVTINEIPEAPIVSAQAFCDAGIVSELPQGNGTYKWYLSSDANQELISTTELSTGIYFVSTTINDCESDKTEVQVTINLTPNAPTVDPQTFCGPQTIANLPNGNETYKWYIDNSAAQALASTTSLSTRMYFVSTTTNNCESERTPVQVTINDVPDAPTVSAQAFCDAATVSELPQGNGTYKWYLSSDANEELTSTTELVTGTYYVSVTSLENCESVRTSVSIVINTTPNAPNVEAQTFCGPQTVSELPQGNGTYKWYLSSDANEELTSTTQLVTGSYFVSTTTNNCESERTQVQVTINEIPNAPTVASQTFCGSQTVANLPNGNGTYKWYNTNSAAQALASTTSLSTGIYFVSTTINGCESEKTQVQVTVNLIPAIPTIEVQKFCDYATVSNLPQGNLNSNYNWYLNATDTEALASTFELTSGIYYVSASNAECESQKASVQVIIGETPAAPIVSNQTFCISAKVIDLPQGNGTYKWYNSLTSTTPLLNTTNLINGDIYYVSEINEFCESERTAVSVNILNLPLVVANTIQTFCGSAQVSDLIANGVSGSEIVWYNSSISVTPLTSNAVLTTGTYYVAQRLEGCESQKRAISVRVISSNAPTVNPFIFCGSATVADLVIISQTGVTHNWYNSPTNSVSLALNTPLSNGTYYVSRIQNGCESLRAAVQVTIADLPNTPTGEAFQTFVEGSTISDLLIQPLSAVWYITYEDSQTGTNPLSPDMPLINGETYYAVSIGTNGCPSLPFAVTVTVTLSNSEFVKNNLKYYPNPVVDLLNIEINDTIEEIVIYSSLGQHIATNKYKDSKIQIDFSSLASGTYMVKVTTKQGEAFIKVVKY